MSKNNKNRQRIVAAKTRNRPKGFKGASHTAKKNIKQRAWYQLKDPTSGVLLVRLNKEKQKEVKEGKHSKKKRSDDE